MTELGGVGARERSAAGPDPDLVREEAERLVAAGLAAVSMAAERIGAPTRERGGAAAVGFDALGDVLFGRSGHRRHSVANGSEECCRCPICRAISAAREPSPEFAEALATGFGVLAQGAARVLRGVADLAGAAGSEAANGAAGRPAGAGGDAGPDPDHPEAAATADRADPWAAATAGGADPRSAATDRSGAGRSGGGAAGGAGR